MIARKCDRCGKLYEMYLDVNGNALYVFNRGEDGEAMEHQVYVKDLCPECMRDFHAFMQERNGEIVEDEPAPNVPVWDESKHMWSDQE